MLIRKKRKGFEECCGISKDILAGCKINKRGGQLEKNYLLCFDVYAHGFPDRLWEYYWQRW